MKVGIYDVYDGVEMPHQKIYQQILDFNNIEYCLLNIRDENFWEKLKQVEAIMYKWPNNDKQHLLSDVLRPVFDSMNLRFFPDTPTSWHYDDKVKQYYLMLNHQMDPVPSYIFFHKDNALTFTRNSKYPLVAKLRKGAGSSNVMLIKNSKQAARYVKKVFSSKGINPLYFGSFRQVFKTMDANLFKTLVFYIKVLKRKLEKRDLAYWERQKNYVYFQKYLPGNDFDTRVTTVGNRVHAFRRFVRKNDFRASGGEEWDINPEKIDKTLLKKALNYSKKMGFQTMAYDFIYDENGDSKLVEISYLYGQPGYPDFMNGYWDENLKWIEGRFWPQHLELIDVLGIPDLKCPNIQVPPEWKKNTIL